jgi:tetratricopeptide (TPR) repeat protein
MSRRPAIGVLAVAALAMMVHAPVLRNGFIWDDDDHVTQNPAMSASGGLARIWTSLSGSRYYPLTLTTFWAQRRLWGLEPLPYHAVNLALHALNAALLLALLRRLEVTGAWVVAALWAVHPVNVESVAWVAELKNLQSGLFFVLSLLCWLQFESQQSRGWYAVSVAAFAAALASKPSTVVLPAVLLLLAWRQRGGVSRTDLRRTLPLFALAAGVAVLTILEQRGQVARAPQDWSLTTAERLILAGRLPWFYAWKLVWPADLMFVYPRWRLNADSLLSLLPWAGMAAVGFTLWQYRHKSWGRAAAFGLGYFVVALLPVLGFFDIFYFRYSFVADHFQYLASIGLLALAVAAGGGLVRSRAGRMVATVVVLAGLGVLSWRRASVFRDDETLWRDTLARNPSAFIAHNNLGLILSAAGQHEQAEKHFREALAIKPDYLEAHTSLGSVLIELGRYAEAEQELRMALRLKPDYSKAHYALGKLCYRSNRWELAKQHYGQAIRFEPGLAAAHYDLGCLWQQQGQRDLAAACYNNALRIQPDYVDARNNLANLLASQGKLSEAIEQYQRALTVAPNSGLLHYNLGLRLMELRRADDAIRHFQQAVDLMPSLPEAHLQLARACAESGRIEEARATLRRALALARSKNDTNFAARLVSLAALYQKQQTSPVGSP